MHKDDNPKNNNVDNLQWATQKENCNTPHHIQELSKSMSGKCGELNNFYGKKHTKRTKEKIRKNRLGKYNLGNHPNAKKVVCENKIFSCLKSCAEWYNINYSTMHSWINNINPMPNKFIQKGLKWLDE